MSLLKISVEGKLYFYFYLVLIVNIFIFSLIIYNSSEYFTTSKQQSEIRALSDQIFERLLQVDVHTRQLNEPGNDIFGSKNIDLEKSRLEKFYNATLMQIDNFQKILEVSQNPISNKISENLLEIKNLTNRLYQKSTIIFSLYENKNINSAAQVMAEMDQIYKQIRTIKTNLYEDWRYFNKAIISSDSKRIEVTSIKNLLLFGIVFIATTCLLLLSRRIILRAKASSEISDFYRKALDSSSIIVITNQSGVIEYVNEQFCAISGYSAKELLGKNHRILNSNHHSKEFFINLWSTISTGNIWRGEIKNKRKDNSYYWVDTTIIPMKNKLGKVQQYIAIRHDITTKKESEQIIAEQKEEFEQFFMTSQDFLCVANVDGFFKKVNNTFTQELGYSVDELLSTQFISFIHKDDIPATTLEVEKLKKGVPSILFQNRYRKKNGEYILLSWVASPSIDGKVYAIARDMTKKNEMEKELIIAKQAAEDASKAKARFLANMSHEIRTPLNGVIGMANLLAGNLINTAQEEKLKIIINSGNNLLELINDILDFSKIEVDKLELENKPFDLLQQITEVLELLNIKSSEKGILLTKKIHPNTPQWIRGDVVRFRQVLTNLIGNAIKFTEKGMVLVTTSIEKSENNFHTVRVSVQDSGVGISENVKNRLFQPFSQVDASTTRKYGGTGLGLSICKGICEKMGGTIWVESIVGKGTTFHFNFIGEAAESAKMGTEFIDIGDEKMGEVYPHKLLIAEDNRINQLVITGYLEKLGYCADLVDDGQKALEHLEKNSYDIVFLDCHMPVLDGFETASEICKRYPPTKRPKIIAVTASTQKDDMDRCFESGMDDFISKPIQIKELVRVLKNQFGHCSLVKKENVIDIKTGSRDIVSFHSTQFMENFKGMEDLAYEMIDKYLIQVPALLHELEESFKSGNNKKLELNAHTLKGMTSNFFAEPVRLLAWELEKIAQGTNLSGAESIVSTLKIEIGRLCSDLNIFRNLKKGA